MAALLTSTTIAVAPSAVADPPSDPGSNSSAPAHARDEAAPPARARDKVKKAPPAKGRDKVRNAPPPHAGGQDKDKGVPTAEEKDTGVDGSPPGNNGTVKIAPHGDLDRIPDNTPHPGCSFVVEWYGFDEGEDVVSTVTFTSLAPTEDVGLVVDGPSEVFVGGDPATGAGTETGLDGRETYTLTFDGEPHAQQGYHVGLVVETPRSNGNDTKSKVFWVEDCVTSAPVLPDETTPDDTLTGGGAVVSPPTPTGGTMVAGPSGQVASGDASASGQAPAEVPTAIASGAPGAFDGGAARLSSMLVAGLTALALLMLLVGIALLRRTRAV